MKKIKVKIRHCTINNYWYAEQVGNTVNVYESEDHPDNYIFARPIDKTYFILKSDCDVIEEATPQPEPFDLERAKKGEPVITRKGAKGKYICTITKGRINPIHVFEINTGPDENCSWTYCYASNGCYQSGEGVFEQTTSDDTTLDLFMPPKEPEYVEGWVAVYPGGIISVVYTTQIEAEYKNNSAAVHKIRFPKP